MKIGWILGWAVPEPWFEGLVRTALPQAAHTFAPASSEAISRLEAVGPFDWVVGYSLGSLLLLTDAARAERLGRVALLAPIFSFPSEAQLGGRVSRAQLRVLVRWLQADPPAALADFYSRAGLDIQKPEVSSTKKDGLLWGLEQLETSRAAPRLPPGWSAWCGTGDVLLDAVRLHELAPEIAIVSGGTHHPSELLRAFAESLGYGSIAAQ